MNSASGLQLIKDLIRKQPVLVFASTTCPKSKRIDEILESLKAKPKTILIDKRHDQDTIRKALKICAGDSNIPKVFLGGSVFGDVEQLHEQGILEDIIKKIQSYPPPT